MQSNELEDVAREKMRHIAQVFLGDFVQRVAVLGAFDTWPYMDHISRMLADNNYIAVTSRYVYRKINGRILRMRTQEHPGFATQYHFMGALLDQIITDCDSAIVNFSISAAHFIEIDWCYKKSKKTLGIAYVRGISGFEEGSCKNLKIVETDRGFYSFCETLLEEVRTVWDCMKSPSYCPFIRQDISKNVIEYFFRGRNMKIVAVEDIGVLPFMLDAIYPPLTPGNPVMNNLNNVIMKDDEVVFTKDCIYFILCLDELIKGSYVNRLSPMKKLALVEKTPGWSNAMASDPNRVENFVSQNLKREKIISYLKDGFADIELIGKKHIKLAVFLRKRGYLELKKMENVSSFKGILVKMTRKGKKLANFYSNL